MYKKKECVAMLLAGGQGSRLLSLTDKNAKPAVSFGGKYRIIDFTLSNVVNSGIDTVGVLTQYQPLFLNEYIGNGLPWDLDRIWGGVKLLPPYQGKHGADWYRGTANAIYQNIEFIENYSPDHVLVLSGDHIYKMDYSLMVDYHRSKNADCTIAVIDVPIEEASRFGIMSTDESGRITKFSEKPKQPDSTMASMGIYVFNTDSLLEYLRADEADENSSNDFGKNVIPAMLVSGKRMYAYRFSGYWKDVGTISSLWEANMDLLGRYPKLDLNDEKWRIYSRHGELTPQFIGPRAKIINSSVTEGCEINGTVINSVIGSDVTIEEGALVKDSVIMSGVRVCRDAKVIYSIIDEKCIIGQGKSIGAYEDDGGICIISAGSTI